MNDFLRCNSSDPTTSFLAARHLLQLLPVWYTTRGTLFVYSHGPIRKKSRDSFCQILKGFYIDAVVAYPHAVEWSTFGISGTIPRDKFRAAVTMLFR